MSRTRRQTFPLQASLEMWQKIDDCSGPAEHPEQEPHLPIHPGTADSDTMHSNMLKKQNRPMRCDDSHHTLQLRMSLARGFIRNVLALTSVKTIIVVSWTIPSMSWIKNDTCLYLLSVHLAPVGWYLSRQTAPLVLPLSPWICFCFQSSSEKMFVWLVFGQNNPAEKYFLQSGKPEAVWLITWGWGGFRGEIFMQECLPLSCGSCKDLMHLVVTLNGSSAWRDVFPTANFCVCSVHVWITWAARLFSCNSPEHISNRAGEEAQTLTQCAENPGSWWVSPSEVTWWGASNQNTQEAAVPSNWWSRVWCHCQGFIHWCVNV